MPIVLSTAFRNIEATALNDALSNGGTDAGGDLVIQDDADVDLLIFELENPAFDTPSGGVMVANGAPFTTTGLATGVAAQYSFRDRDDTVLFSGTVVISGAEDDGDLAMDSLDVTTGQGSTLPSLTLTIPA